MDMAIRPNVSPHAQLYEDAVRTLETARSFLTRYRRAATDATLTVREDDIRRTAEREALIAAHSGNGTYAVDSESCTPRMRELAESISEPRIRWNTEYNNQTVAIRATRDPLQTDVNDRRVNEPRRIEAARDDRITEVQKTLEGSTAFRNNREKYRNTRDLFEALRALNGGKHPKRVSRFAYVFVLLLVGIGEWFINYQTFLDKFPPILAVCATVFVAIIVAVASHYHGLYFKQYHYLIRQNTNSGDRASQRRFLAFISFWLVAVLVFVFWARFTFLSEKLGIDIFSANHFGDKGTSLLLAEVGPTMFFNGMIWFIGVILSWSLHERVPGLREANTELRRLDREKDVLSHVVQGEIEAAKQKYETDMSASKNLVKEGERLAAELTKAETELLDVNDNYSKQHQKRLAVVLSQYAQAFAEAVVNLEKDGSVLVLEKPNKDTLTLSQFSAVRFELRNI